MILTSRMFGICSYGLVVSFLLQRHVVEGFVIVAPPSSFHTGSILSPSFPRQIREHRKLWMSPDSKDDDDDDDSEWTPVQINEVLDNIALDDNDEADDWIPDRERARKQKLNARIYAEKEQQLPRASPYTEDEEELIAAMGGKTRQAPREQGFLGDSTLQEICRDYSVPICYVADVLCLWGTPPPIHVHDRLGDLVTGEQAFAMLEAINSLDVAALQDRYSNQSLWQICQEWEIDLPQGFQMAMTEGWSLPFGVHTNLRVEQENELIRVLGNPLAMTRGMDDDDEDYEWDDDDD